MTTLESTTSAGFVPVAFDTFVRELAKAIGECKTAKGNFETFNRAEYAACLKHVVGALPAKERTELVIAMRPTGAAGDGDMPVFQLRMFRGDKPLRSARKFAYVKHPVGISEFLDTDGPPTAIDFYSAVKAMLGFRRLHLFMAIHVRATVPAFRDAESSLPKTK